MSLKIVLEDIIEYPIKGFGSIKFDLNYGKSVVLHEVMYILKLKNNLVSIFAFEDKGTRVSFIKGNVLTWLKESLIKD